jgi:hypothetical protein
LTGHSYVFHPDKPAYVLPMDTEFCYQNGASYLEPEQEPKDGNIPRRGKDRLSASDIHEKLTILFESMADDPVRYRQNFTAAGRPNVRWAASTIDTEVSVDMVNKAWNEVMQGRDDKASSTIVSVSE